MKNKKFALKRNILLTALVMVLLSCTFLGYILFGAYSANALSAVPTTTSVSTPIYDFNRYCYNREALNELADQVLPSSSTNRTIEGLISYATNTAGNNGQPISRKNVTLKYGRYRYTPQSIYRDLAWMPVYISRSVNGDAILTLYLGSIEPNMSVSQQESLQFSNAGTYSTNPGNNAPSNSYGTSHMRAVSLGNLNNGEPAQYAYYRNDNTTWNMLYTANIREANCNKYSDFITGSDFKGLLTDDIATPSEMAWQEHESYADTNYFPTATSNTYCLPNEAYGTPSHGNYYNPGYFDYNEQLKVNYNIWQYDKVWLPSLTEVGNGDIAADTTDTTNGIWKLTATQRSNPAHVKSWLRTANTEASRGGNNYSTYTMYATDEDGNIASADVNEYGGIRPCIHLNLSKIVNKFTPPVNLPDQVTVEYNGEEHEISSRNVTVPMELIPWYDPSETIVTFFSDEACIYGVAPLYAGTYYMMVQLTSADKYFVGEDQSVRMKTTKFVIEKVKLSVEWEYNDDNSPRLVKLSDGTQFHDRDIQAGNVPEIGMKYSNITGAGIQNSPTYPDKKGTYTATAYIIDEELHNYNYELSGTGLTSKQFLVKEKKIDEPCFEANGELELRLSYRGRQYVQIKNISSYVTVEVTATNSAALDSVEDLGVIDDVQTFIVEAVTDYRFTVKLNDKVNTMWASGTDTNPKNQDIQLNLSVTRALITVVFDGLPSSWETSREMQFDLTVLGVYENSAVDSGVEMAVYYVTPNNRTVQVLKDPSTGKFIIRGNSLSVGEYTIYAVIAGTGQWTGNYIMETAKTQKFSIVETVSTFNANLVVWQYMHDGRPTTVRSDQPNNGQTEETAVQLPYTGNPYAFTLTLNEERLRDAPNYVRATYSGDTYVTAAGNYRVRVAITAYDKNVVFTAQYYNIYFTILKTTYDLSGVRWSYDGTPFEYTGSEQKITIDSDTLPDGLTVWYNTEGGNANGATNVGRYTTNVVFIVSDEYAVSYKTPNALDPESYTGSFDFSCLWEIVPQQISVQWNTENLSGDLLFVPTLVNGDSYVDYSFEHKVGENWVACDTVTAETVNETYRVTPSIKPVYAANFVLVNVTPCEFEVASGKHPVTVTLNINGGKCDDGEQFAYTGSPFVARPVVGLGDFEITDEQYSVEYYTLTSSGARGERLTSAPVDIGSYLAVATIEFSNAYLTSESETEVKFEIIKADYDISQLRWQYVHGNTVINATYDPDQRKFVDDDGREVTFSFEYDGKVQTLNLIGNVDDLSINGITGNSYTNAGDYNAIVSFGTSPNYNEPKFPVTLAWSVSKAKIHFEDVRWGYIDNNGVEHEYDFENDKFVFTRNASGPVAFRVGLLNLPDGVNRNHIRYTTTCLTQANGSPVQDNAASAIGVYHTTFSISGTFNDPNYEQFTAMDMPSFIPTFLDWEITERELTRPNYDGSWVEFDNRTHNIIEMCGIPEDELYYYSVEVTFMDYSNKIYNNYEGYEGEPFAVWYAGIYTVRFYERRLDSEGNEEEIFFAMVDITVEKENLEVTWDTKGSIPVARVSGVYVQDMIGTRYTNENGGAVTREYIATTDGIKFFAEPYVREEYAQNIGFVMANGNLDKVTFTSSLFRANNTTAQIERPRLAVDRVEWTGEPVNFEILYWDAEYWDYEYNNQHRNEPGFEDRRYVYLEGDSLTQTAVGKYSVIISFFKDANAYWDGTNLERGSVTLEFEIIPPTSVAIEYPRFDKVRASVSEDGSKIVFTITNWVILKEYIYYEYSSLLEERSGVLSHTRVGIYTVVFRFYDDSIGYWANAEDPKAAYTVELEIYDPDSRPTTIRKPEFVTSSQQYTGRPITFELRDWDEIKDYIVLTSGSLTATEEGSYSVTFRTVGDIKFSDNTNTITLTYRITSGSSNPPLNPGEDPDTPVTLGLPALQFTQREYTGLPIQFLITNWDEISRYVEIVEGESFLIKTDVGEYTFWIRITDTARAHWAGGTTNDISLHFSIVRANIQIRGEKEDGTLDIVNGEGNEVDLNKFLSYEYTDDEGNKVVVEYDGDGNRQIVSGEFVDGKEYRVSVTLKPDPALTEEFENSVNAPDVTRRELETNSYSYTYVAPGGVTPILIITIAVVGILVFLVVMTIVVLAVQRAKSKRESYAYYDDYDYDDYDDYEEDD